MAESWEREFQRIAANIDVAAVQNVIQYASTDEAGSLIFAHALELVATQRQNLSYMRENKSGADNLKAYDFTTNQIEQTFIEYFDVHAKKEHYIQRPDAVFSLSLLEGDKKPLYIFVEVDGPNKQNELRSNAMKQWQAMNVAALSRYLHKFPCVQVRMNLHSFHDPNLNCKDIPQKWTARSHLTANVESVTRCLNSFVAQQCQASVFIAVNTVRMMMNLPNWFQQNETYSSSSIYDMCLYVGDMTIPFPKRLVLHPTENTDRHEFGGRDKHKNMYRNTECKVFENSVLKNWSAKTRTFCYSNASSMQIQCVSYERVNMSKVLALLPSLEQSFVDELAVLNAAPKPTRQAGRQYYMQMNTLAPEIRVVLNELKTAVKGLWSTRNVLLLIQSCSTLNDAVREWVLQCFFDVRDLRDLEGHPVSNARFLDRAWPRDKQWGSHARACENVQYSSTGIYIGDGKRNSILLPRHEME